MKKKALLLLSILLLIPTSAQAITWKEFFDAIKEHKYDHLFPVHATNKTVTCIQIVSFVGSGMNSEKIYLKRKGYILKKTIHFTPVEHTSSTKGWNMDYLLQLLVS